MNKFLITTLLASLTLMTGAGTIDLDNMFNYANQSIPSYISKDNSPQTNLITDAGATLGRVLFYDKKLSTNNTIACASCHQQQFAFGDTARFSLGVNNITRRHSMRLVNIRFGEDSLFRWDRSAARLEDQMINPIKNFDEMGYSGTNGAPGFNDLIDKLTATEYYAALFHKAFGDTIITEENIANALAQFVRSIQSFDAKYDVGRAQVNSDTVDFPNFTLSENNGKRLFMDSFAVATDTITVMVIGTGAFEDHAASRRNSGGFNCASCHRPPEFDIDPASLNNGFVGGNSTFGIPADYTVTRSPTLRDILDTDGNVHGPLFHSGFTNNLSGLNIYNFRKIDPNNNHLDPRYTPNGLPQWLDMTNQERSDLIAFLETLSGTDVYSNEKWSDPFDENGNLMILGGSLSIEEGELISIWFYPNPTHDKLFIESRQRNLQISLHSISGQSLGNFDLDRERISLDLGPYPKGVYLIRAMDQMGKELSSKKIIKY